MAIIKRKKFRRVFSNPTRVDRRVEYRLYRPSLRSQLRHPLYPVIHWCRGWPKMILEIWQIDDDGRHSLAGYAFYTFPFKVYALCRVVKPEWNSVAGDPSQITKRNLFSAPTLNWFIPIFWLVRKTGMGSRPKARAAFF